MLFTRKTASLVIGSGFALMLTACDRNREADPEPATSGQEAPQTSILREGFEEPEDAILAMSPLEARISFADGGDELSESAVANLETILNSPQMEAGGEIVLRAHSDAGGSQDVNMEMSEARGTLVRDWMIERGIGEDRITVIAFGEQNPVRPNAKPDGSPNERGRAANRRVDITVALPEEETRPTIAEQIGGTPEEEDELQLEESN